MAQTNSPNLIIGNTYSFRHLERWLNDWNNTNKCLIVLDKANNQTAVMHTFGGNFCGDWKSGDGILFYNDNEQHSAEPETEFQAVSIIEF